jgi:hypothetical protein
VTTTELCRLLEKGLWSTDRADELFHMTQWHARTEKRAAYIEVQARDGSRFNMTIKEARR